MVTGNQLEGFCMHDGTLIERYNEYAKGVSEAIYDRVADQSVED